MQQLIIDHHQRKGWGTTYDADNRTDTHPATPKERAIPDLSWLGKIALTPEVAGGTPVPVSGHIGTASSAPEPRRRPIRRWTSKDAAATQRKGLRKKALRKRLIMEYPSPHRLKLRPPRDTTSNFPASLKKVQQCEATFRACDMEAQRIKLELADTLLTIQRLEAEIAENLAESKVAQTRAFQAAQTHSEAAEAAERVRRITVEGAEQHTRLRMYRQVVKGKRSPLEKGVSESNYDLVDSSSSEEIATSASTTNFDSPNSKTQSQLYRDGVWDDRDAASDEWTESLVATAAKGDTDAMLAMLKIDKKMTASGSNSSLPLSLTRIVSSPKRTRATSASPPRLRGSATISAGDIAGTRTPRGSDGGQALPRSGSLSSIGSQSSFGSGFSSLTGLDAGGCCDVDVDAPDSRGRTALYAAVYGNHFRMMRLLLKLGADPNRPSMSIGGNSPRRFLARRARSNSANKGRRSTALHAAVMRGNIRAVQLLVAHGAELSATDAFGTSVWESLVLRLPSLALCRKVPVAVRRRHDQRCNELGFRLLALMRPYITTVNTPPTTTTTSPDAPTANELSVAVPRDLVMELLLAPKPRLNSPRNNTRNGMPVGLERACFSAYIPSTATAKDRRKAEGPCTRALLWRLLLRYLPWDSSQWDSCLEKARMHYCDLSQKNDPKTKVSMDGCRASLTRTQRSAVQRVLSICATQHPELAEAVYDIQEVACVLFEVFHQEIAVTRDEFSAEYQCMTMMEVEADTYGCLQHLLSGLGPLAVSSVARRTSLQRGPRLRDLMSTFMQILNTVDKKLHSHLVSVGVNASSFCGTWLLTLCAQDVGLSSVVHCWDLFLVGFSRGGDRMVSSDLNLVLCFCVALVHSVRALLLKGDAPAVMTVLRSAPQVLDFCVKEMVSETCRIYSLCLRKGMLVYPAAKATVKKCKRSAAKPLSVVQVVGESAIISMKQPRPNTITIDRIRRELPRLTRIANWRLVFALRTHGANMQTFERCASLCGGASVLLLETCEGDKLGAYISESLVRGWSGHGESFVFSFGDGRCTTYPGTTANSRFAFLGNSGDPQGGGVGFGSDPNFAIYVDQELEYGSSGKSSTYGNPPLTDAEEFELLRMELWSIDL